MRRAWEWEAVWGEGGVGLRALPTNGFGQRKESACAQCAPQQGRQQHTSRQKRRGVGSRQRQEGRGQVRHIVLSYAGWFRVAA